MPCYIILHNVPKSKAQIDLFTYPIQEGFRGFRDIPPGVHYVSVKTRNGYPSFWCYLKSNETISKVFNNISQEFEDDDPAETAYYQELASLGAMDAELIAYESERAATWLLLTNDIKYSHFPVTLHSKQPNSIAATSSAESLQAGRQSDHKSEFAKVLFDTHGGDAVAFLAEFQFAFARWFVSELDCPDIEALNHWRYLVEAVCNAEISDLAKAATAIATLVGNLITQLESVDDSLLNANDPIVISVRHLAQEMVNSDIENFVKEGHQLKYFLKKRWNLT
jgi:hypothetical protein